ncbi:DNA replication protein DnaC [Buchnera aphidicola (Takecallis arundicolens)]|uniref:ATP-binding protein n=1 Tax=Buchnera aphidicola TaxID=9 RepID=UPI003463B503
MNNTDFLKKLKNIIPSHITPKFTNQKDLLHWNQKEGKIFSKKIIKKNEKYKIRNAFLKSGIRELYINCSFQNYKIEHEGHKKAIHLTKKYAKNFDQNNANFVFLGRPGTGKNHLATAISNYLILKGKKILIITIANLMSTIKATFKNNNTKMTEEKFIYYLSNLDLLILDEIGIQTESKYEKIVINQIIDRRASSKKPIGMLSNCNYYTIKKILGERIIDRMQLSNSLWLYFNWKSYRNKTSNIS